MDLTPYWIALIVSLPGWGTVYVGLQNRRDVRASAKRLEQVHDLVNSQSQKLNAAIEGKALAEGELKGRTDAVAAQQAGLAMGKDKEE